MYSQNNEELVILEYFNNKIGTLLDIGAYDGIQLSNSRKLLELGWKGILVEPDPRNLVSLMGNSLNLDVTIIGAAVSTTTGLATLRIENTKDRYWASSISSSPQILNQNPIKYKVPTIHIDTLLDTYYDFISIDTEHMDFDILKSISSRNFCSMLCIEPQNIQQRQDMKLYLQSIGFTIHYETNENIICISEIRRNQHA